MTISHQTITPQRPKILVTKVSLILVLILWIKMGMLKQEDSMMKTEML